MVASVAPAVAQPVPPPAAAAQPKPEFIASILAIVGGQAACALIAFITEICYARFLGPASRGIISLCLMSVAFGTLIGGVGGEGSIILWASSSKKHFSTWLPAVLSWALLGCGVTTAFWIILYWRIHPAFLHGITPPAARLVSWCIPAAILFSYAMSMLTGLENFRLRSSLAILRQVAGLVAFLPLLLFLGRKPEVALISYLVGLLVVTFVAIRLLRHTLHGFWKVHTALASFKPTLIFGLRGQLGGLATFFTYRFDVFIVNYFLEPAQLGFYALGVVISEALWQLPQAVALALFPRTARTGEQEASRFTCFLMHQVLLISCLAGAVIALISPVAIPLVFGAGFNPSIAVIWWIMPGTIALALAKVACSDLAGRGKNGYASVISVMVFVLTIGLDWFLIPRMHILGAALASSIAYFADGLFILIALRYEIRVSWKELLIPTREELLAYRGVWARAKALLTTLVQRQPNIINDPPGTHGY